jgi:hypothetical protein
MTNYAHRKRPNISESRRTLCENGVSEELDHITAVLAPARDPRSFIGSQTCRNLRESFDETRHSNLINLHEESANMIEQKRHGLPS